MGSDLAAALALLLVFEGILPFLVPRHYRESLLVITRLPEARLRLFGLIAMVLGLALLTWVRG